jgi:NADH-quinone oxidoreductase subunit K
MIPLSAYVAVSAVLFITGLLGVLIRRNFIIVLMSVEIMLNAANINLIAFSHYLESMAGQMVALFIIAIAAGEAAVGLAIIIVVFLSENKIRLTAPWARNLQFHHCNFYRNLL